MPLSPYEFLEQQFPGGLPDEFKLRNYFRSTDDSPSAYSTYLNQQNEQFADITDPYGNVWTSPGSGYRLNMPGEDGGSYELTGGADSSDYMQSQYADLVQGLQFKGDNGATYIPKIVANQIAARSNEGGGWIKNFLDGPGPVMLLASLFTAGAASGFGGSIGSTSVAGGPVGAGVGAADALGLEQMAAAAGLPPGSAASQAFIASGGTMGSTAAGGLGTAGTLAESFGYATPGYTAPTYANWYDPIKTVAENIDWTSGLGGPPVTPYDFGLDQAGVVDDAAAAIGQAPAAAASALAPAVATGAELPTIQDTPLPAAPKPGAPNYQELWGTYAGWMDNINRINEGAFADVRARLSAAGAAPDLIKMQTEHLESQRASAIEGFNKSTTFELLKEGHDIALGNIENRYEGGLSRYAGGGKPELMDFYTELYGQPARGAGPSGEIGTGGTPSTSGQTAANPWFEDPKVSLIG